MGHPARDSRVPQEVRSVESLAGITDPQGRRIRSPGVWRGVGRTLSGPALHYARKDRGVKRAGPRGPTWTYPVHEALNTLDRICLPQGSGWAARACIVFSVPSACAHLFASIPGTVHVAHSLRLQTAPAIGACSALGADRLSVTVREQALQTHGNLESGGIGIPAVSRRKIHGT